MQQIGLRLFIAIIVATDDKSNMSEKKSQIQRPLELNKIIIKQLQSGEY